MLKLLPLLMFWTAASFADPAVRPNITWNNQQPKQQQALDAFYRSMERGQLNRNQRQLEQNNQRQIQAQQLRRMTPSQRQQMFINYINQHNR